MKDILNELNVILNTVAPEVKCGALSENTALRGDLGLDSLQLTLFAVGVEDNYDIRFTGDHVINTIGDLAEYIINYRKGLVEQR